MRDFIEELRASDDIVGFLMDHRKETLKFGVLILGVMTALLLLLYRGGDEVDIRETAAPLEAEDAAGEGYGEGDRDHDGRSSDAADPYGQANVSEDGVTVGNGEIYVDIGGAVKTPMLAKLTAGSRVEDAIQQAGGLSSDADITQINRAEILTDGQKIYIPKKGENVDPAGAGTADGSGSGGSSGSGSSGVAGEAGSTSIGKVNINTADITQLQTLTGVGPVTAQKIIDYRTQSGKFSKIEDLKNVSGIGEKTFENMKDLITV